MTFIENLNWRYATKKFDGSKISDQELEKILTAIRLCPTSFGIQPFHISVIADDNIKEKINGMAFWDQKQVETCSHVLIFSEILDLETRTKNFVELASQQGRKDISDDPDFDYVKGTMEFSNKMGDSWASKQLYIALGFALAACAELKIDSCAMEAANFGLVGKLLGLGRNYAPRVLLAIGRRSPDDLHSKDQKLRFGKEELFDF